MKIFLIILFALMVLIFMAIVIHINYPVIGSDRKGLSGAISNIWTSLVSWSMSDDFISDLISLGFILLFAYVAISRL